MGSLCGTCLHRTKVLVLSPNSAKRVARSGRSLAPCSVEKPCAFGCCVSPT
jgi:hypothetical protein